MQDSEDSAEGALLIPLLTIIDLLKDVEEAKASKIEVLQQSKNLEKKIKYLESVKTLFMNQEINTVHLTNIPWSFEENDLRRCFQKYGTVTACKVYKYNVSNFRGSSTGRGIITFSTAYEANNATFFMNMAKLKTRTISVSLYHED